MQQQDDQMFNGGGTSIQNLMQQNHQAEMMHTQQLPGQSMEPIYNQQQQYTQDIQYNPHNPDAYIGYDQRQVNQMRAVKPIAVYNNNKGETQKSMFEQFTNIDVVLPWKEMLIVFFLVFLAHPKITKQLCIHFASSIPNNSQRQMLAIFIMALIISVSFFIIDIVVQKYKQ